MGSPRRGEVWLAQLSPIVGHEQGGARPVLVVSTDAYNAGPAGLVVVVPITSGQKHSIPMHLPVGPPEGGLRRPSVVLCDAVRSISTERLQCMWGRVSDSTLAAVTDRLTALLDL